eukprot:6523609-Pyramimonas_sp.AAC.1
MNLDAEVNRLEDGRSSLGLFKRVRSIIARAHRALNHNLRQQERARHAQAVALMRQPEVTAEFNSEGLRPYRRHPYDRMSDLLRGCVGRLAS